MLSLSSLYTIIYRLQIFNYSDMIEILFFSVIIYFFLLWLKQDTQKNLIFPFYIYCTITFISYYANLNIISTTLFLAAPLAIIIFIILHQNSLQKNFVMLKKVSATPSYNINWLEEFIRSCLSALNNNKEFICVIERSDQLQNTIKAPCIFYADFKKDIFDILIEKHTCKNTHLIWINHEGKIVAINATLDINISQEWMSTQADTLAKWKQDGIFISSKTDAIIIRVNPLTRTFDIIIKGKIVEGINTDQAFAVLQYNLDKTKNNKTSNFNTAKVESHQVNLN